MSTFVSSNEFTILREFLKHEPLERLSISRIIHELWSVSGVKTEELDCGYIMNLLDISDINIDSGRKRHLQELKDTDKMRFSWNELKTLMDASLFRNKFNEQTDWRIEVECTIGNVKDKVKNGGTSIHERLFGKLCNIDINNLTPEDPLSNGVIDLGSNKFQLSENDFDLLIGDKAGIRRLMAGDATVVHSRWVERENDRECIARGITECLMQLVKTNSFRRISRGSENTLVEVVARLIDLAIYQLPINSEVEVTRNERQSVASKNRKAKLKNGARGNKPDFMIQAFLGQKWNEIVYGESGKWNCNEEKILDDHNKLVRFCIDGYKEISKKREKDDLRKNYIAFGVNVAGDKIIVHGLIRENEVKYYLPIAEAKIPLRSESVEVEEFIHVLMVIRR
ncbi:12422_t:CDS:2 [Entrophospora sp. SA101]|nr:3240_t:CDS:2 [Entrophospora sp. SA101]CAJ0758452.1 12422_t:CDS:2 [Entrophospora sp. SA101]CAJ0840594.1 3787_t:CDS:2 [Entrophospora sp. SA101]